MRLDPKKVPKEVKKVLSDISSKYVLITFLIFLICQQGCTNNKEIAEQDYNSSIESQTFQRVSNCLGQKEVALSDKNSVIERSIYLGQSIDMIERVYRKPIKDTELGYDYPQRDVALYYEKNFKEKSSYYDGIIVQVNAYLVKNEEQNFFFEFHIRQLGSNPYCLFRSFDETYCEQGARIVLFAENDNEQEADNLAEISKKTLAEAVYDLYDKNGVKYDNALLLKPRLPENTEIDRVLKENASDDVLECYLKTFREKNIPSTDVIVVRFHHSQFSNQLLNKFKNGVVTLYVHFNYAIGPWNPPGYLRFRFPILEIK